MRMQFVFLVALLAIVCLEALAFAVYARRLAKRLKRRSPNLYKEMMPDGWFLSSFGTGSVARSYTAARRLQESGDQELQQEGRNLKTVKTVMLVVDIVLLAMFLKTIFRI